MVEPLLSGIVLALIPVTIAGLFVTAFLQFRRSDQLNILNYIFQFCFLNVFKRQNELSLNKKPNFLFTRVNRFFLFFTN